MPMNVIEQMPMPMTFHWLDSCEDDEGTLRPESSDGTELEEADVAVAISEAMAETLVGVGDAEET